MGNEDESSSYTDNEEILEDLVEKIMDVDQVNKYQEEVQNNQEDQNEQILDEITDKTASQEIESKETENIPSFLDASMSIVISTSSTPTPAPTSNLVTLNLRPEGQDNVKS